MNASLSVDASKHYREGDKNVEDNAFSGHAVAARKGLVYCPVHPGFWITRPKYVKICLCIPWTVSESQLCPKCVRLQDSDKAAVSMRPNMRIAVGEAFKPHRIIFNHVLHDQDHWNEESVVMNVEGWEHKLAFLVFSEQQPGTCRISVGESGPTSFSHHRIMIFDQKYYQSRWDADRSALIDGWKHRMDFWAYTMKTAGTIPIRIFETFDEEEHRAMIICDSDALAEWDNDKSTLIDGKWKYRMTFWAFPSG